MRLFLESSGSWDRSGFRELVHRPPPHHHHRLRRNQALFPNGDFVSSICYGARLEGTLFLTAMFIFGARFFAICGYIPALAHGALFGGCRYCPCSFGSCIFAGLFSMAVWGVLFFFSPHRLSRQLLCPPQFLVVVRFRSFRASGCRLLQYVAPRLTSNGI